MAGSQKNLRSTKKQYSDKDILSEELQKSELYPELIASQACFITMGHFGLNSQLVKFSNVKPKNASYS